MPTYQYACTACEHRFDAVQKFSDASLAECPQCTGRLRKVFSSVGIVFKGSGFYRTDSRKGGSMVTSGEAGSSDGGKDSGSGSGSEKSGSEKSGSSGDKAASSTSGDKAGSSASKVSTSGASSTPAAAAS